MKAAAVCYRTQPELQYLLVRTKNGKHWVFPKGGVKDGEKPHEAAAREAAEEAGVTGKVESHELARFDYAKGSGRTDSIPAFLLEVSNPDHLAPEEAWRESKWYGPGAAETALRSGRNESEYRSLIATLTAATRRIDCTQ